MWERSGNSGIGGTEEGSRVGDDAEGERRKRESKSSLSEVREGRRGGMEEKEEVQMHARKKEKRSDWKW